MSATERDEKAPGRGSPLPNMSVRMPPEILARVDAVVAATGAIPGARSNRTAVIVAAIDRGLESLEREAAKRRR